MQQSKQLSKQHTYTPDDGCHQFKFPQLLPPSFDVLSICWCHLLLAENDLNIGSHGSLHVVPELPINSQFSTTPYCQVIEGFMSTRRIVRFDSISTFSVPRSPSVKLRPPSRFSIFQY